MQHQLLPNIARLMRNSNTPSVQVQTLFYLDAARSRIQSTFKNAFYAFVIGQIGAADILPTVTKIWIRSHLLTVYPEAKKPPGTTRPPRGRVRILFFKNKIKTREKERSAVDIWRFPCWHWLFCGADVKSFRWWKKPAAPKGLPRRSPTPVLTGPCSG